MNREEIDNSALIKARQLREVWEQEPVKRLEYRFRPKVDLKSVNGKDEFKSDKELYDNIKLRLRDLAEVLELMFNIYKRNPDLYGDEFLAFTGNRVVRDWPWKDFPFISEKAKEILETDAIQGLDRLDIKREFKDSFKDKIRMLTYEHWTPISLFRDVFKMADYITKDVFYYLLVENYRIVWVTNEENKRLNEKNLSKRTKSCYKELKDKIDIYNEQLFEGYLK